MSTQCSCDVRSTFILYLILFSLTQKCGAGRQRICGKALTDVLASVCVNGFNIRVKRCLPQENDVSETSSPDGSWYYRLKYVLGKLETDLNDIEPKKPTLKANSTKNNKNRILIRKRKQVNFVSSRGVADECCTHSCTFDNLLMYCA